MVTTSGFTSAPVSRILIFSLVSTSLLSSILDIKYLLPIKPTPHLWPYLQFSRIFTFQTAYISSPELLFAVTSLYHLRVLERLWGSRKFASFVAVVWSCCALGVVVLGVMLKVLSWGKWGYIPPGTTGLVFGMLAVWKGEVPALYQVKVSTGLGGQGTQIQGQREGQGNGETTGNNDRNASLADKGVVVSDKFTTYLLAGQLALSQFPYQVLPALVGWVLGVAWREELLPMGMMRWRVPGWVVGESGAAKRGRGQYEGLRRRLEEEGGGRDGMREVSDGVAHDGGQRTEERRGFGRSISSYFTGS